jgi:2-oxoglutarate dehydrogenase E1 component
MDQLIRTAGTVGVQEMVIGMAHRGRLNVLVNTLGKQPSMLFDEFEGKKKSALSAGDVKYHMGYSSDVATPGGPVHLTLAFNPSHLEIVNPVVAGSVYARQVRRGIERQETGTAGADPRRRRRGRPGREPGNAQLLATRAATAPAARCISW